MISGHYDKHRRNLGFFVNGAPETTSNTLFMSQEERAYSLYRPRVLPCV